MSDSEFEKWVNEQSKRTNLSEFQKKNLEWYRSKFPIKEASKAFIDAYISM